MPTHTPTEMEALVLELKSRPGVGNPWALAQYILDRRKDNPGRRWKYEAKDRTFSTEEAGCTFRVYPSAVPHDVEWPMEDAADWTWWWLDQDGDSVAMFHIMGDGSGPALRLADEWISLWMARVGVTD